MVTFINRKTNILLFIVFIAGLIVLIQHRRDTELQVTSDSSFDKRQTLAMALMKYRFDAVRVVASGHTKVIPSKEFVYLSNGCCYLARYFGGKGDPWLKVDMEIHLLNNSYIVKKIQFQSRKTLRGAKLVSILGEFDYYGGDVLYDSLAVLEDVK